MNPEQIVKLVDEIRQEYDYIIIDCPAGIEQGFRNAIAAADRAVIVTTPEVSAIRDADRIIGLLEAYGIEKQHLIINRIKGDPVVNGHSRSGQAYMSICKKIIDDSIEAEDHYNSRNRSLRSLFRRKRA